MKHFILSFIIVLTSCKLFSQDCGTTISDKQAQLLENLLESSSNKGLDARVSAVSVPLKFFIIRRTDGTGGLSPTRIPRLITELNTIYRPSQITFRLHDEIEFIDRDDFYDFSASQETTLSSSRDVSGVVNMYISNTLTSSSGGGLCGYTRFPPSVDRVFLSRSCVDNEVGTTAHELGHYFSLYHTHGKTNTGTTDELVARINCESLGDNLCDTPADPNLTGLTSGCSYTGSEKDANGDFFKPDVKNIMSYAPNGCRDDFSPDQFNRIRNGLERGRNYLNLTFQNFSARFTASQISGCSPLTVVFEDITGGSSQREWIFEGGDIERSARRKVEVTYEKPGIYSVALIAENQAGAQSTFTLNDYITVEDIFANVKQGAISESFKFAILDSTWTIFNYDELETFKFSNFSADDTLGSSIYIENYTYESDNSSKDVLELTNFNVVDLNNLTISFKYSYSSRPGDFINGVPSGNDSLLVGYSLDCDEQFFELFKKGGEELSTVTPTNDFFVPNSTLDWLELSFNISKKDIVFFEDRRVIRPAIININDNGNNLYLDNFSLLPNYNLDSIESFRTTFFDEEFISLRWFNPSVNERGVIIERSLDGENYDVIDTVGINQTVYDDNDLPKGNDVIYYRAKNYNNFEESTYSAVISVIINTVTGMADGLESILKIYPNPVKNGNFSLSISNGNLSSIRSIDLLDLSGRIIYEQNIELYELNSSELKINIPSIQDGLVFVRLTFNDQTYLTKKLYVQN